MGIGVGDDEQERVGPAGEGERRLGQRGAGNRFGVERVGRLRRRDDAVVGRVGQFAENLAAGEVRDGQHQGAAAHGGGDGAAHGQKRQAREVLREVPVLHVVDRRHLRAGGAVQRGVAGIPERAEPERAGGAREREVLEEHAADAGGGAQAGRDDRDARGVAQVGNEGVAVLGVGEDDELGKAL